MKINLSSYKEKKPHRASRIAWAIVNATIFRVLPSRCRNGILRSFGAKIGNCLIYRSVDIFAPWNLSVGDDACIGPRVSLYNKDEISIGKSTVVSQDAYICTASHDISSPVMATKNGPIRIGDCAWVAAKSIVIPNVCIGDGAVVGIGSVVVKDVEPWTVVGGNPAKVLKKRVVA